MDSASRQSTLRQEWLTESDRYSRMREALLSLAETLISPRYQRHLDASDLVQQTLLEAHQGRDKLLDANEKQLFAWLRVALRHNILDAVKSLRSAKNDVCRVFNPTDLGNSFDRLDALLAADETSPSEVLVKAEKTAQLLSCLQRLPAAQRNAVILKHLRGMTLREVALEMESSETAVAGLLHRGRKSLADLILQEDRNDAARQH